jgi:hypothetical protein
MASTDDARVAYRFKSLLRPRPAALHWRPLQPDELRAGVGKLANVVLDSPNSALDGLHAVVRIHIFGGVVRRLELLKVESPPNAVIAFSSAAYCLGRSSRWRTTASRERFLSTGLTSGSAMVSG